MNLLTLIFLLEKQAEKLFVYVFYQVPSAIVTHKTPQKNKVLKTMASFLKQRNWLLKTEIAF